MQLVQKVVKNLADYGFLVGLGAGELAGFMFEFGAIVFDGFMFEFGAIVFVFEAAGVATGAAVATGAGVAAGLFTVLLAGASPQAIPRALNPRTVESTITFVMLFSDSYLFSKMYLLIY